MALFLYRAMLFLVQAPAPFAAAEGGACWSFVTSGWENGGKAGTAVPVVVAPEPQ